MIEPTPRTSDARGERMGEVRLELFVREPDLIRELVKQGEGEARRRYAQDALRIGLLALKRARGEIDAEQIRTESTRLLDALKERLESHQQTVHDRIEGKLKEYFDPSHGRFAERVERLVRSGGELEQVMGRLVGSEDSELRKTLENQLGLASPLMKVLSPSESEGLLQSMTQRLDKELRHQRETILREFSLDNTDSALTRLVRELNEQQGDLVKELDLNEEGSALNKLVGRVELAQRKISDEFSLDREDSALARMRRELLSLFGDLRDKNATFQADVMTRLGEKRGAEAEAKRGTQHGLTFEGAVFEALHTRTQATGDLARATGNEPGLVSRSKKGDVVIEFGPDSAASGAKIVVEAKQQASFTLALARDELSAGIKNRGAQGGLFVFSRRTAPAGLAAFQRLGRDVFVVWDSEDESSDVILDAGLAVARALVMDLASEGPQSEVDYEAIDKAINEIEKQIDKVTKIQTSATTIQNSSGTILEQARILSENLARQVGRLRDQVQGLKDTES